MQLTNQELLAYTGRIKLTRTMKAKYTNQIDNLVATVKAAIDDQEGVDVTRVLRAGSWKKGTALRPREEHPLDIDLAFFLDIEDSEQPDVAHLNEKLLRFLLKAFPTKDEDDFNEGEKTVNLVFRGSGLRADLVPVVPIEGSGEYVWQPTSAQNQPPFITSVEGQLAFVSDRKKDNPSYTSIVRILKTWRSRQELDFSSFAIELIAAHLDMNESVETGIEIAIVRFFEFTSRESPMIITFPSASGTISNHNTAVYLGDPTYAPNNVLERTNSQEWEEIRANAETAWETLELARSRTGSTETLNLWKEVFGPHFNIEEEGS